jgi:hypothetical protein
VVAVSTAVQKIAVRYLRSGLACALDDRNHIIRRHWPSDPLQLELADRLDLHHVLDLGQHSAAADEYLPWLRFVTQPRCNIGYRTDSCVVEPTLEADGAKRREAVPISARFRGGVPPVLTPAQSEVAIAVRNLWVICHARTGSDWS